MRTANKLRPLLLAASFVGLAGVARALPVQVKFAILNLPDSSYLQMEVSGLDGTREPRIDSIVVRTNGKLSDDPGPILAHANMDVHWSLVPSASLTSMEVRTAQIIQGIPHAPVPICKSCTDSTHSLVVDSLVSRPPRPDADSLFLDVPHVDNSRTLPVSLVVSDASCLFVEDSVRRRMLVEDFQDQWARHRMALEIAGTEPAETFAPVPYWRTTSGREDHHGFVLPWESNRGNWIHVEALPMGLVGTWKSGTSAPGGPNEIQIVDDYWEVPTGAASYVYDRTVNPDLKIQETTTRRQIDTLLKIGSTLRLDGTFRADADGNPFVDSLFQKDRWLILADSSNTEAILASLAPIHDYCMGRDRRLAWRITGDTVWLDPSTPIHRQTLLALVAPPSAVPDRARGFAAPAASLFRTPSGMSIRLEEPSSIRTISAHGRILSPWEPFPEGRHHLGSLARPPAAFVQVSGRSGILTLSLVP
ncbi:MAG: hypothetical protein H6686_04985 [Fibrobacteria bacterium]|nr:hypothetical protein [Fibrobacteria bacterium]